MISVSNPLVSIIMPTYNCAEYISESIRSVLNQTYNNWELLIIDDCSTDETSSIVSQYTAVDNRIKYFYLSRNSGNIPAVPKNYGLHKVRGDYVAFLDSDDVWLPKKLEYQIYQLENNKNIAFSYVLYHYLSGGEIKKDSLLPEKKNRFRGDIFKPLYLKPTIPNSAVVVPIEIMKKVGMLDESPKLAEDGDILLRLAKIGKIDYIENEPLLLYRVRYSSHSSGVIRPWMRVLAIIHKHIDHAGKILFINAAVLSFIISIKRYIKSKKLS